MSLTGQDINGYLIGPRIGGGAMGEVYQAFTPSNEKVAIKVMRGEFALDPAFQERFVREIRLQQSLDHPNIVPILDQGTTADSLYFVMRLISGPTLSALLQRRQFSPLAVWNLLKPVAEALDYGHGQGVLHRDVKPGNIFVERTDKGYHIFLGDYGLGKKPGVDRTLTELGVSIGTPEYMSPEAVIGEDIDYRTDQYSLAVVMYEMLLGVLPFDKGQPHLTAMAHINDRVPAPLSLRQDFPLPIQTVLLRALSKDKSDRFRSVQDFAQAYYTALSRLSDEQQRAEYWVIGEDEAP